MPIGDAQKLSTNGDPVSLERPAILGQPVNLRAGPFHDEKVDDRAAAVLRGSSRQMPGGEAPKRVRARRTAAELDDAVSLPRGDGVAPARSRDIN